MKVIILAAGEGSRLRPLTLEKPKCLVELFGKVFLDGNWMYLIISILMRL